MTRTFSDRHPKVLPACNFLSQYYFYNIFLQKSCRFSLQTLTKFEAAKTGSGVGFLRLTAVWIKYNRPFPSSHVPLFQSESKCETILMIMTLICMRMELHAELIFIWKASHLDSFWNGGTRELGNGLFLKLCSNFYF